MMPKPPNHPQRTPLSTERVIQAAIDLVDEHGLDALTMRRLGASLGVQAMSLYKHVANKDEILTGMLEIVIGKIELPEIDEPWKEAIRRRATSAREVFTQHSWAIGLLEAGVSTGPSSLSYPNAILGNLISSGFSMDDAGHAFWILDSFIYGQVIQEVSFPFDTSEDMGDAAAAVFDQTSGGEYPHLTAAFEHALNTGYSTDREFEFGLEFIISGLEQLIAD